MLMPRWFLILNGVALLLMGGAMLAMRLRPQRPERDDQQDALSPTKKVISLLWAALCCVVGLLLLGMAAGRVRQPGEAGPWGPGAAHRGPAFPTDR